MSFHHAIYLDPGDARPVTNHGTPRLPMRELPPKLIDTGSDLRFCPVCNRKYTMTQSEKQVVKHPSTHKTYDNIPILCCEHHEHKVKVAAYRLNSNLLCIDREMLGHGAEALQSSIDEIDARLERVRRD